MSNKINLILLFLVMILSVSAQFNENPDGSSPSLHITPFVNTGSIYESFIVNHSTVEKEYQLAGNFNISARLKIPVSNTITISPFAEYANLKYSNFDSRVTRLGATFSFYFQ